MTQSSSRYWLASMVLTVLGVWRGWLPTAQVAPAGDHGASAVSSAAGAHSSNPSAPPASAGTPREHTAEPDAGSECPCARALSRLACACEPAPDPCARGQELLDEYAALYHPGTDAGKTLWSRADYLLALVPDPALTEHSSTFAAVLEGLEEAIAAKGDVVSDRSWLPWGPDTAACPERAPGVMLFRPQDLRATPPRIVLLVGETPTWGVRKKQLEAALTKVPADPSEPLKVLGPTFSGTAESLLAVLDQKASGQKFDFVSGTATSPALPGRFEQAHFSFRATVPDDQTLLSAMLAYLRRRGNASDRIALLSEAGTAYGSNVSNPTPTSRSSGRRSSTCSRPASTHARARFALLPTRPRTTGKPHCARKRARHRSSKPSQRARS